MILRLGILLLVALLVVGVWAALRFWRSRQVAQLQQEALPLPESIMAQIGGVSAAILSFSTRTCVECRTRQAPALKRLVAALGANVRVVSVDPLEHPDLVSHLGILTVPATVVLDAGRHVRHLNLGYASEGTLQEQIAGLGAS